MLPLARCPLQLSSEVMQGREDVGEDVTVILPLGILLKKQSTNIESDRPTITRILRTNCLPTALKREGNQNGSLCEKF